MASYSQQSFFNPPPPPASIYPPTPAHTHQSDEFSPLQQFHTYTDFNFGFSEPQPHIGGGGSIGNGSLGSNSSNLRGHTPHDHEATRGRSSSEEKDLTPGQVRRKAQNRAAQRAFRERKERHVKELQARLSTLEQSSATAVAENDALKQELQKMKIENRLLQENTSMLHSQNQQQRRSSSCSNGNNPGNSPEEVTKITFKPTDASDSILQMTQPPPTAFTNPIFGRHPNKGPIHRISTSPGSGERLLGAGAAWDLIVCHPLYEQGLVDIADISERLKGLARCDGQGPVFEESVVLEAIHASSGSGSDELFVEGGHGVAF